MVSPRPENFRYARCLARSRKPGIATEVVLGTSTRSPFSVANENRG